MTYVEYIRIRNSSILRVIELIQAGMECQAFYDVLVLFSRTLCVSGSESGLIVPDHTLRRYHYPQWMAIVSKSSVSRRIFLYHQWFTQLPGDKSMPARHSLLHVCSLMLIDSATLTGMRISIQLFFASRIHMCKFLALSRLPRSHAHNAFWPVRRENRMVPTLIVSIKFSFFALIWPISINVHCDRS